MNISDDLKKLACRHFALNDARTWPYFPIEMPLKDGLGPAEYSECDRMTYEVWDRICDTHGRFDCLPDAINHAMKLNLEFMEMNDE